MEIDLFSKEDRKLLRELWIDEDFSSMHYETLTPFPNTTTSTFGDMDYRTITYVQLFKGEGKVFTKWDTRSTVVGLSDDNHRSVKSKLMNLYGNAYGYALSKGDQEFVNEVVDQANALQKPSHFVFPVQEVADPRELISAGLFPTSCDIGTKWFHDWVNGMDMDTIAFLWSTPYDDSISRYLHNLTRETRWVYKSLDTWKQIGITTASSVGLLQFLPKDSDNVSDLVYSGSRRPVNNMSMFRTPASFIRNERDIVNGRIVIQGEQWNVIKAVRYAAGMRRGLFDPSETPEEFCGTFFYHEPESTTYLAYKTSHRSFNKYTAYQELLDMWSKIEPEIVERIRNHKWKDKGDDDIEDYVTTNSVGIYMKEFLEGTIPKDLMLTPMDAFNVLNDKDKRSVLAYVDPTMLPNKKCYTARFFSLYAAEDGYDQPLCLICKRLGIDILILDSMIGSFQVVTEILDSRSREDSFRSLIYTR